MTSRVYNFCAGPAALPTEVLEQAQADLLDYQGKGMSLMEMSHRSEDVVAVSQQAIADFRQLMGISDDYEVLYMQGGATAQFAAIPLNLLGKNNKVDFIDTGMWSAKAIKEAKRYADVHLAASTAEQKYSDRPSQDQLQLRSDAAYLHYTPNETIGGVEFDYIPESDAPLVADFSSSILSQPIDVNRYGLIYAGAQKNIGPSGMAWVIVRKDLLDQARAECPTLMNYEANIKADSMLNTPPSFSVYLCGLVFKWLLAKGGPEAMAELNATKAKTLYDFIDANGFYQNPIAPQARSRMNVPFTLANPELDKVFVKEAEAAGLSNLAGHRSVGGMRASIYNAMPLAGVEALVSFMADFEKRHG